MKTENVKQIIQELFRQNYNAYPESYPLNVDGTATDEASECVANVAKSYYANRTEDEIERDEKLGITEIDYVEWCMEEFSDLIPADESAAFSEQDLKERMKHARKVTREQALNISADRQKEIEITVFVHRFIELYAEEIAAGKQITGDAIHEWYNHTKDQITDNISFEEIEREILKRLK